MRRKLCLVLALVLGTASCSGTQVRPESGTIRVPQNAKTITEAVDAAHDGDLILVDPGVYKESVRIKTPNVTLRGTKRGGVVIDGEVRRANGIVVTAAGVTVENLTVRNHTLNGVLFTGLSDGNGGLARGSDGYHKLDPSAFPPLQGFRVSYVTASNNALYGIYAFDAQHGVIEDSYASGSADSGFYVGQCKPCDIVVRRNVAERNAVGYEGTNASGDMFVLGNRFSGNRVGMTSNSDYQEAFVPQENATIAGNLVTHNAEPASPAQADGAFGLGIGLAGGRGNMLLRNRVSANPSTGLALGSSEDLPPQDNKVRANVITGNGVDFAYTASTRSPGTENCLQDNEIGTSRPEDLKTCATGPGVPLPKVAAPRGVPFTEVAPPPAQPDLPDAATAPAKPARGLPGKIDLAAVVVPSEDLFADRSAVRS
ncbi:nitrous oxide reductase family maturation protein NosD [Amycolatopsis sp. cg5]|uniref:right-handed parallel beta-helix repeat-containing protein n=1 Tax=Amycolatopsis sp. cg5 TaxID=3238802 RepID=UPI0035237DFD